MKLAILLKARQRKGEYTDKMGRHWKWDDAQKKYVYQKKGRKGKHPAQAATADRNAKIIEAAKKGATVKELEETTGVSAIRLRQILNTAKREGKIEKIIRSNRKVPIQEYFNYEARQRKQVKVLHDHKKYKAQEQPYKTETDGIFIGRSHVSQIPDREYIPEDLKEQLRQHQSDSINLAMSKFHDGEKAWGNWDGTGSGKTRQEIGLAETYMNHNPNQRVLIVTENDRIISSAFGKDGQAMKVPMIPIKKAEELKNAGPGIYVTSYKDLKNLRGEGFENIGLSIFDECFPGDTKVITDKGVKKIKEIVEKQLPVKVLSYDFETQTIIYKPIIRFIKNELHNRLVKINHTHGSLLCTGNHKLWSVSNGVYTQAEELRKNEVLLLVSQNVYTTFKCFSKILFSPLLCKMEKFFTRKQTDIPINEKQREESGSLAKISQIGQIKDLETVSLTTDVEKESNGTRNQYQKDEGNQGTKRYTTFLAWLTGWQWKLHYTAINIIRSIGLWLDQRVFSYTYTSTKTKIRNTYCIQDRHCTSSRKDCSRSRRKITQYKTGKVFGQKENYSSFFSRVEGIEIQKSRHRRECSRNCKKHYVYNLEIADTHNYFANGILVSNCHNMKNAELSKKAKIGLELIDKSSHCALFSATPVDKAAHMLYLCRAFNLQFKKVMKFLGFKKKAGQWNTNLSYKEISQRYDCIFRELTERGLMVKREVPLDGLYMHAETVKMSDDYKSRYNAAVEKMKKQMELEENPRKLGLLKAQWLLRIRAILEESKLDHATQVIEDAIKEKKQVVLFATRVNDSMLADAHKQHFTKFATGALNELSRRLEEKGISFSSIFGSKKGGTDALKHFQSGKHKVLITTPGSGGTGLSMDDVKGDAPRVAVIMTPPFSAVDMIQLPGRVHRLTTKSKSEVKLLSTDTAVEQWNKDIIANKLATLGAVVKGDYAALSIKDMEEAEDMTPDEADKFFKERKKQENAVPVSGGYDFNLDDYKGAEPLKKALSLSRIMLGIMVRLK